VLPACYCPNPQLDLYQVLGLNKKATLDEVKSAYRKLAREWHPDKRPESEKKAAETMFTQIGEAYEILSNDELRQEYDKIREGGIGGSGTRFSPPDGRYGFDFGGFGFDFEFHDPFSIFEEFFGGSGYFADDPLGDIFSNYGNDLGHGSRFEQQPKQQQQQQQQQQQHSRNRHGREKFNNQRGRSSQHEEIFDYTIGGRMFRKVATYVEHEDGSVSRTAQDYEATNFGYYPIVSLSLHGADDRRRRTQPGIIDGVLRPGEYLNIGASLASPGGFYALTLLESCDLVVHKKKRHGGRARKNQIGKIVWQSGSLGAQDCFAMLQENGMLVVMQGMGPTSPELTMWSSPTRSSGFLLLSSDYFAMVQDDGNFVIFREVGGLAAPSCVWATAGCDGGGRIRWRSLWRRFKSSAGEFWCQLRGDCELGDTAEGFQRAASAAFTAAEPVARNVWNGILSGTKSIMLWAQEMWEIVKRNEK
jgi:curved DNA-binding protein CbpA